jgi:hypothetical protein
MLIYFFIVTKNRFKYNLTIKQFHICSRSSSSRPAVSQLSALSTLKLGVQSVGGGDIRRQNAGDDRIMKDAQLKLDSPASQQLVIKIK